MAQDDGDASGEGQEDPVHPAFGFAALSDDVEPPVEVAQEVSMETEPREDRPNPEFYFDPTGLYVEPGDTVRFSANSPFHNVMAYHPGFAQTRRVPEETPPISSPMFAEGAYWLYTFDRPGVYDLYCGPHEFLGMVVRVVVGEASGPGAEPVPEPSFTGGGQAPTPGGGNESEGPGNATEAPGNASDGNESTAGEAPQGEQTLSPPAGLAASILRDDALAPENVVDAGTVAWDDIADENKEFSPGGE
nr:MULTISPECIES: plastocyanin/azurin family copper-binding protein [Halostella]